ncbi:LADA_0H14906g1_1 [Lachancea dasiensis]|uniref:LADA_0H14906g1_1 n=1 Tax=Lachancea dasiensis TaxID=1072105 RepID=A0A1G4K4L7_9SACH|nr:LADA_0H14906g1_1 [Lachancea dasiensis]
MLRNRRNSITAPKKPLARHKNAAHARTRFTILDIIRMVCGLILIGFFAKQLIPGIFGRFWSRETTGEGPGIVPAYWRDYKLPLEFSHRQLRDYDGTRSDTPILLAIKGKVYDVTRKSGLYGPRGTYRQFAGADCSRAFSFSLWSMRGLRETCSDDLTGLSTEARQRVDEWARFFHERYPCVGEVKN